MNRLKLLPFFGALAIVCPAQPCRVGTPYVPTRKSHGNLRDQTCTLNRLRGHCVPTLLGSFQKNGEQER